VLPQARLPVEKNWILDEKFERHLPIGSVNKTGDRAVNQTGRGEEPMFCCPEDAYDLIQKHWMMCVALGRLAGFRR
jgi:hypothetical protein